MGKNLSDCPPEWGRQHELATYAQYGCAPPIDPKKCDVAVWDGGLWSQCPNSALIGFHTLDKTPLPRRTCEEHHPAYVAVHGPGTARMTQAALDQDELDNLSDESRGASNALERMETRLRRLNAVSQAARPFAPDSQELTDALEALDHE